VIFYGRFVRRDEGKGGDLSEGASSWRGRYVSWGGKTRSQRRNAIPWKGKKGYRLSIKKNVHSITGSSCLQMRKKKCRLLAARTREKEKK